MTVSVQSPVAIVGMGALFPGSRSLAEYRDNVLAGVDAIAEAPADRWDPSLYHPEAATEAASSHRIYTNRGGFVDDSPEVSVARFGIMPSSVAGTEPDQLLALEIAAATLADAGGLPEDVDRSRVGIILGRGGYMTPGMTRLDQRVRTAGQLVATIGQLLPELDAATLEVLRGAFTDQLGPDQPDSAIGLVPNLAASRVANRLDLRGPAYTVDAACASSLIAVDHAVRELESGRLDLVLAGGVHHAHDITLWSVFAQLRALSVRQRSTPFDAESDGILIGEGTGMVALKRLADARRDGDRVYAVIRGTGVASDGRTASLMNPDPGGQTRAVRDAWARAGLDPTAADAVGLIEAHGTGTPAGDSAELETLAEVFGPAPADRARAVLGSVKSMIGHAMPAAGAAGLIKTALAIYHGVLPPTLGVSTPHPALAATRFTTQPVSTEWRSDGTTAPRRAGVNAFGFGGINAHLVVEQLPDQDAVPIEIGGVLFDADDVVRTPAEADVASGLGVEAGASTVLLLAAASDAALSELLARPDDEILAAAAIAPGSGPARVAIVAPDAKRLALARKAVARGRAWNGRSDVWYRPTPLLAPRSGTGAGIAFLFPGLEAEFAPRVDDVIERFGLVAPRGVAALDDESTSDIARHGSAVLQVSRLLADALERLDVQPDSLAGHSLGEWSAMVVGGIFSPASVDAFLDDLDPASLQVPGLAFAVVGAPALAVRAALLGRDDVVLSHDNAPNQSMICGPLDAVDALVADFRSQGVLSRVLPFSSGFHTPMFADFLGPVLSASETFALSPARVPVWSATTVAPFPDAEEEVREIFVRHLLEAVRFRELVERMHAEDTRVFIQLGPGQLGTLVGDTLSGEDHLVLSANAAHRTGLDQLRCVLAGLWVAGRDVDLGFLGIIGSSAPARVGGSVAESAGSAGAQPALAADGPVSRLDLGGAFVRLDASTLERLAPSMRPLSAPAEAAPAGTTASGQPETGLGRLRSIGSGVPATVAGQLHAFLAESDALIDTLLTGAPSAAGPTGGTTPTPVAVVTTPTGPATSAIPAAPIAPIDPIDPPVPPGGSSASGSGPALSIVLPVSVPAMPHLADHCFFLQRDDWADVSDRFPVVPGTTIVRHLMDAAESIDGRRAIAVHSVRLNQWVDASVPTEVVITGRWVDSDRLATSFGSFAHGTIELESAYPADRPAPWTIDRTGEEPSVLDDPSRLYTDRWMFHGPRYRGVTAIHGTGPRHVRGTITTPEAPGSLLDNVGQLLGYWLMSTHTEKTVVFPVGMQTIRFYGEDPAPGTALECSIVVTALTDTVLQCDVQLILDGRVWAEIVGWQDRRFDNAPETQAVEKAPHRNTLSAQQPEGWVLVHDRWPDLASRDLIMRNHLAASERESYRTSPPRHRKQWLLGRIAAKDAARRVLWGSGEGPLFPAEIAVDSLPSGQPVVSGRGRDIPPLAVSIAHSNEAGVALVWRADENPAARAGLAPGIDVETILDRPESLEGVAFTDDERALLEQVRTTAGTGEWVTRFWGAKEAVGKAYGTGLAGRPRDFEIIRILEARGDAAPDDRHLLVATPDGRRHTVATRTTENPPGLPDRRYVVSWTTGTITTERDDS